MKFIFIIEIVIILLTITENLNNDLKWLSVILIHLMTNYSLINNINQFNSITFYY